MLKAAMGENIENVEDLDLLDMHLWPSEREVEISERWSGKPLKQIISFLRTGKHQGSLMFVASYDRWLQRQKAIRRETENERARELRAAKRVAPQTAIEAEGRTRLKALDRAIKYRRGDKLLEQLVGRSDELTNFWIASALAALNAKLSVATDAERAAEFSQLTGKPCNKDQARSRRKIIERLDEHPGVWLAHKRDRYQAAATA
ncbi:hypothetical protein [Methylobacterium thuringiense]|uniref:Uncharacterized protein n=1 Tax=Methylobacterium thuringiense TaxID=1003091 RepID=A0ABQ4TJA8_9HYPH|nr:hypothetical protein [Methylobacterium thuringiense]GJE53918.1 hypothetical protein EKPJFOCH_0386 [Methylobacterium thuringiense]